MAKLKVGIIGVGGISEAHIQAYRKNPDVELYAFCDINETRLNEKADRYGIEKRFTSVDDMVALDELDAVSVCTWNCAHAECSIKALLAGKHVLCEKPMAMNPQEAEQMMAAAEKSGKLLMIGFVRRYGNDMQILKEVSNTGYFGELYYAKANYLRRNGNPGGWFADSARSGGGPLMDLGVHVIDFVRYALGNPKPISVYGATFTKLGDRRDLKTEKDYVSPDHQKDEVCDVEDLAAAMIRFEDGSVLNVETSFSLNNESDKGEIELFGDKGGVRVSPNFKLFSTLGGYMTDTSLKVNTSFDFNGSFCNEINHFVDCINGRCECISPAEDGFELMKVLDAIYKSAESGHEIIL